MHGKCYHKAPNLIFLNSFTADNTSLRKDTLVLECVSGCLVLLLL